MLFALLLGFLQGVYGQYGYAGPIDSLMAWYKLNDAVTATTAAVRDECQRPLKCKVSLTNMYRPM